MMVPSLIRLVLCLLLYYLPGTLVCFRFEIFVPSINPRCSVSLGVGWLSISLFRFTGRKVFAQGGQVFGGRSSRRLQESKTVQQNAPTHAQGETTLSFTFPPPLIQCVSLPHFSSSLSVRISDPGSHSEYSSPLPTTVLGIGSNVFDIPGIDMLSFNGSTTGLKPHDTRSILLY